MAKTFLSAEWRKLVMANYVIDQEILLKYLPHGTELDLWNGNCYVSLIGFMFKETRVKGVKIPLHVNFEEVNLRFYVKYQEDGSWKRGVVFIKEIVPKRALAIVANTIYKEKYQTLPMRHHWEFSENELVVEYQWNKGRWNSLKIVSSNDPKDIEVGTEEEFITEHYWGYTKIAKDRTSEYEVLHPRWKAYTTLEYTIDVDFEAVYGSDFAFLKSEQPKSVFMAEGSEIEVKSGKRI